LPKVRATVAGKPTLGRYKCKHCGGYRFSAVAKFRPFLKSHIPLSVWFAVIFLDSRIRFRAEDLSPKSKPQLGRIGKRSTQDAAQHSIGSPPPGLSRSRAVD
jgi:hypothetical protein